MKTRKPLILTAHVADHDMEPFDRLRQAHFPPDRNHLSAHLTMFHRLPGEYASAIEDHLAEMAGTTRIFSAEASGLRHLGAGVAFTVTSPMLEDIRANLKARFAAWLGPQDQQKWQPHITVQNKVLKPKADQLYGELSQGFKPCRLEILGLDLWEYLGGPWRHQARASFGAAGP